MTVSFEKVSLGKDEDGEEQFEYQLLGTVDGQKVKILSKSAGYVEHLAASAKERSQGSKSS